MKRLTTSVFTLAAIVAGFVATASVFGGGPKSTQSVVLSTKESTAKWHAKKVTGEHFGTVELASGTFQLNGNKLTGGTITVNMKSIDVTDLTGEWKDKLVGHLKSDDFFSVEKHTEAVVKIKSATEIAGVKASEGKNNYQIVADLTVKGITKEITFPAMIVINKGKVIANAEFNIDRTLYDIRYGSKSFFTDIGDKAIDNDFNIKVRVVAQ